MELRKETQTKTQMDEGRIGEWKGATMTPKDRACERVHVKAYDGEGIK